MRRRAAIVSGYLLSAAVMGALSPIGPAQADPAQNLQVLRKDVGDKELKRLMDRYSDDLGVSCSYCHVENPQTHEVDYISDENPLKQSSRMMISMLNDINKRYLAQLEDRRYALPFTCGNCHQGHKSPPEFVPARHP